VNSLKRQRTITGFNSDGMNHQRPGGQEAGCEYDVHAYCACDFREQGGGTIKVSLAGSITVQIDREEVPMHVNGK
jgi:hypothetical protein